MIIIISFYFIFRFINRFEGATNQFMCTGVGTKISTNFFKNIDKIFQKYHEKNITIIFDKSLK